MATHEFTPITPNVARLMVQASGADFGAHIVLDRTSPLQIHQLGFQNMAPMFHLHQPFAPDDRWIIDANMDGEPYSTDAEPSLLEAQVRKWLLDSSVYVGLSVFNCLPAGEYYVLQSDLKPRHEPRVYIGNEAVVGRNNITVLLDDEQIVHSVIVGFPSDRPPNYAQPLLGVVICHDTGVCWDEGATAPHQHIVVFFSLFSSSKRLPPEAPLLLIVPASGELLIDNLQLSTLNTLYHEPPTLDLKYVERWSKRFLASFIYVSTGEVLELPRK